jgi:D-psicose/D-tagatose/L-ribulose 3-epimerase
MKFGINSLLFTDTFLEKDVPLLAHCREMGFDTIEITPIDPDRFPARMVRQTAADLGMSVNINFALPEEANPLSPDVSVRQKSVELSRRIIDLCTEVGAEVYCGSNYCTWRSFTGQRRTQDEWNRGVECYRTIAEYASQSSNLILGVETLNRFESYFLNTAADTARFVDDVNLPNVTVHLDTFHQMNEEDNMGDAIRACGSRVGYFHACGSQRGVPGKDLVPWQETFDALRDINYDYCITIESFHPRQRIAPLAGIWRDFSPTPEDLATQGLAFVKEMYTRTFSDITTAKGGEP